MSATFANIRSTTSAWTNLVANTPGLSGLSLTIQNNGSSEINVVFGGSSPSSQDAGNVLKPGECVNGAATAIWVKGYRGFSVSPLDNG